ncbi:MAG: hypothetical protein Q4F21_06675 [Lachnospiraceae bacterium]|nr:hypothetical protein [Lachnospiraceae bacterium]
MNHVYTVTFIIQYENTKDNFLIGFFSSYKKAKEIRKYYSENVIGFKDNPEGYYEIEKIKINAKKIETDKKFYYVNGWNENEYGDEIDIVISDLFEDPNEAKIFLKHYPKEFKRQYWIITGCNIDKCYWEEGFLPYN